MGTINRPVRQHIAVEVIRHSIAVIRSQSVISIVYKRGVCRAAGDITGRVVSEGFGRNYRVISQALDGSCSNSVETIISIAHFGGIGKRFE